MKIIILVHFIIPSFLQNKHCFQILCAAKYAIFLLRICDSDYTLYYSTNKVIGLIHKTVLDKRNYLENVVHLYKRKETL